MDEALQAIVDQYNQIKKQLEDPTITDDIDRMVRLSKEMTALEDVKQLADQIHQCKDAIKEADLLLDDDDEDMIQLAQEQKAVNEEKLDEYYEKAKIALLPKDPNDTRNIFLEIRPGAGGSESSLFATELCRAYLKYADLKGRTATIIEQQRTETGGTKFAMINIRGDNVYAYMKFESGVHRVQRIPATESQGRLHTSTISVAIMPEAKSVDVEVDPNDVVMDTFGASSAGGQNANKNQNGVRLHHTPTGIIVTISDTKSQLQNKEKAYQVLLSKLYQQEQDKLQAEQRALRGSQIGTADRSEKIRTYNFPQDRVTDHRIKQSRSNIMGIMNGDFDDIIHTLSTDNQRQLLAEQME